jgi:hypothetical protein
VEKPTPTLKKVEKVSHDFTYFSYKCVDYIWLCIIHIKCTCKDELEFKGTAHAVKVYNSVKLQYLS